MAIIEHPNEWASIPTEQVIDWLDHPCTRLMRAQIGAGLHGYDELAIELVNSPYKFTDEELRSKSDQIRVGKLALKQALDLIEKAEAYVKG